MIAKSKVIKHFRSVSAVAEFFGIEVQAVYQWEKAIPRERELELMLRLPVQFPPKVDQNPIADQRRVGVP